MKKAVIVVVALLVAAASIWLWQRVTVEKMTRLVQRELPPGTPASRLATFLDSLRISHSEVRPTSVAGTGFPHGPARLMHASIQDLRRGNLLADGVFMVFRFDEQDRLIDYVVDYSYTFL